MSSTGSYRDAGSALRPLYVHVYNILVRHFLLFFVNSSSVICCSKPVELECLFNSLPNLSQRVSSENIFGGITNSSSKDSSVGQINAHGAYTLPMLIDSRCIPLLSKLVEKSVQLGHHQQFLKIYRSKPL